MAPRLERQVAAPEPLTVVAAVNDRRTLAANLLRSPALTADVPLLFKEGYPSAPLAYNAAIDEAATDLLVFVHQDIFLPAPWFAQIERAIATLDREGVRWGVLGCFGMRRDVPRGLGRVYTNGRGVHGTALDRPEPVDTLDEIVLVMRRSSGLRFDPRLPHFHLYGVDLCLQARRAGLLNFAAPAFCIHNTHELVTLPWQFYACHRYIRRKWAAELPISASCMPITRVDWERRRKRVRDGVKGWLGRLGTPVGRAEDPRSLLRPEELARLAGD